MPGTPITIPSAQGATFTFGAVEFRARAYDSSESVPTIDTTDCSQPEGDLPRLQPAPISDPTEVNLECWGNTPPTKGTIDTLTCSKLGGCPLERDRELMGQALGGRAVVDQLELLQERLRTDPVSGAEVRPVGLPALETELVADLPHDRSGAAPDVGLRGRGHAPAERSGRLPRLTGAAAAALHADGGRPLAEDRHAGLDRPPHGGGHVLPGDVARQFIEPRHEGGDFVGALFHAADGDHVVFSLAWMVCSSVPSATTEVGYRIRPPLDSQTIRHLPSSSVPSA